MSAEILKLSDYRNDFRDGDHNVDCKSNAGDRPIEDDPEIDLVTAVDVAVRDLREILSYWGSEAARQRAEECELMLRRAYLASVVGQPEPGTVLQPF